MIIKQKVHTLVPKIVFLSTGGNINHDKCEHLTMIGVMDRAGYIPSILVVAGLSESTDDIEVCINSDVDVPMNEKLHYFNKDYKIIDKSTNVNGGITYFLEDEYLKCENFDDLYKEKIQEASVQYEEYIKVEKERRETEVKYQNEGLFPAEKSKSIWWYFGIR